MAASQETPKWAIKLKCDSETPIRSSLNANQLLSSLWVSSGSNSSRCLCVEQKVKPCLFVLKSVSDSDVASCPPSGAIAGIVDQPMQNFQRSWEVQTSAGSKAKGVISGVGKGIVGVFTKPIGGAAELVSQTGYGEFGMLGHDV